MISVIVALGIVSFLILFLILTFIKDKEHFLFRFLLLVIFFNLLILISRETIYYCDYYANYTNNVYQYGVNFSGYHWDYDIGDAPNNPEVELLHVREYPEYNYICSETASETGLTFFTLISRLYTFFWIYVLIFVCYKFLEFKRWLPWLK